MIICEIVYGTFKKFEFGGQTASLHSNHRVPKSELGLKYMQWRRFLLEMGGTRAEGARIEAPMG